jgi:hypothetical protein
LVLVDLGMIIVLQRYEQRPGQTDQILFSNVDTSRFSYPNRA